MRWVLLAFRGRDSRSLLLHRATLATIGRSPGQAVDVPKRYLATRPRLTAGPLFCFSSQHDRVGAAVDELGGVAVAEQVRIDALADPAASPRYWTIWWTPDGVSGSAWQRFAIAVRTS